jgi:putative acetyltransferase
MIRSILQSDNVRLAQIIRTSLEEFGAHHPGTVYDDPSTDNLFELFQTPKSYYFVATRGDVILGGGGIFPTAALPYDTIELVKMYLVPEARGMGLGKALLLSCIQKAKSIGYTNLYLESMPELSLAISLYERMGFFRLDKPLGKSEHYGCSIWMNRCLQDTTTLTTHLERSPS